MFPARYFSSRYWASGYWAHVGAASSITPGVGVSRRRGTPGQTRLAKPYDVRWPGPEGMPRLIEDINANFDALFALLNSGNIPVGGTTVVVTAGANDSAGTGFRTVVLKAPNA